MRVVEPLENICFPVMFPIGFVFLIGVFLHFGKRESRK